jgi:hypothetical protein
MPICTARQNEAGSSTKCTAEILQGFGRIWEAATSKERRQIVHTLLETVHLDADQGPVVAIEPKCVYLLALISHWPLRSRMRSKQ